MFVGARDTVVCMFLLCALELTRLQRHAHKERSVSDVLRFLQKEFSKYFAKLLRRHQCLSFSLIKLLAESFWINE